MNGPLFVKPSRRALTIWAVMALVNLTAGIVISSQPLRVEDLATMRRWGAGWLIGREDLYFPAESMVDYPPNAIVLLSPLSLLPEGAAVPVWILANLCLAMVAPYMAARHLRPHDSFRAIALPVLMFLTWGGIRTLTQFTLLPLACGMVAMLSADRRPFTAGVWLGAALIKPQVGIPVFMWAVFTRRWRMLGAAVGVSAALTAVFCLWSDADPIFLLVRYTSILSAYHAGDAILSGVSELRPLIRQLVMDLSEVDAISLAISLGLFSAIAVAGFREGRVRRRALYAAPPMVACWSLLSFYHLTYGFVILLPALMLLAMNDTRQSRLRVALFWLLQIGMMIDIPGLSRRAGLADSSIYTHLLWHADRALIVVVLAGLVVLAWQERDAERASGPTAAPAR